MPGDFLKEPGIVFELPILCLPKAPGCQLLEAGYFGRLPFSGQLRGKQCA